MASDYLSRNPLTQISTDDTAEHFISMIVSDAVPKTCTLKELIDATKADDTLQQVMKFVTSGRWSHDPRYHIYHQIQDQLSINNDLHHDSFKIQMSTSQDVRDPKVCLAHGCSRYTGTLPYWQIYPPSHRLSLTVPSHCHYKNRNFTNCFEQSYKNIFNVWLSSQSCV